MKIFVSWSGEASRRAADVLHKYLPCMLQELRVFMSQHDVSSGTLWSQKLASALAEADFGILCLTPDNLQNAWILFEAGALTGHANGRACCLLYQDLRPADVSGPLSQFQNATFAKHGFGKLVADINGLLSQPLEATPLNLVIEQWWPVLENATRDALTTLPPTAHVTGLRRADADILEEIVLRIRNIEQQMYRGSGVEPEENPPPRPDRMLAALPRQQLLLLGDLVSVAGVSTPQKRELLEKKYSSDDVTQLLASRVVTENDGTIALAHDSLAKSIVDHVLTAG